MLARTSLFFALTFVSMAASAAPETAKPAAGLAAPAEAKRLENAFAAVGDRVAPSVVQIDVLARDDADGRFTRWVAHRADSPIAHGAGSGVVFTADGVIVTNNHLIEDALAIQVRLADGRQLSAKLVGRDPATDLAVLKVDAQGLVPAKFVDDKELARPGQWVVAVGAPFGTGITISAGVIGAKGRPGAGVAAVEDYLQTDADINALTTGGPVCDLEGRVLGIGSDAVARGSRVGFVVPAALVRRVAEQLVKTGRVVRPWIGATFQDLTPDLAAAFKLDARAGVLLTSIADNGPAKKANLKAGDVIAAVGGKPVHDPAELQREILAHDVGQTIACEVVREGQHYSTQVALTARVEPPLPPVPVQQQGVPQVGLGFNARDLSAAESAQRGLTAKPMPIITVIAPGSSADRAGLRVGDVIVEADGVVDPNTQQLQQASQDGQLLLRVRRRDISFYAAVRK